MTSTKKIHTIVLLLTLYGVAACAPQAPSPAPAEKLTLIGTGDLQGRLEAAPHTARITESGQKIKIAGGISRLAFLIKQIKQESDNPVLVVSSGDDLMGRYFHQFSGKAIFTLMAMSGYEVLALGNHEFDHGPGVLAEALASVSLPALCSDLEVQATVMKSSCQPYLLRDYQGLTIGFFSLMTENFPVVTVTGKVQIRDSQAAVAREMIDLLRKQGAQVIIAITHIGTARDRNLAAKVAGIDIIFGGHSHNYQANVERVNNTLIVNGGEKGAALVRLDVPLDGANRPLPAAATYSLLPVTTDIKPDPGVEEHLAQYRRQLPATTVLGRTDKEWNLSRAALRSRESAVADMVTDLIRNQFKVDVVLNNAGSFRGDAIYPPGPVTDTMLAEIDEFESNIYLLTIQGKYLRQILEHSASRIGQGGFLQVSGIQFTIDPEARPQQLTTPNSTDYSISQPGERIQNIRILSANGAWLPLDPEQHYRLAANDFLVKRGGDRYYWFKKYGRNIQNTYSTMGGVITDSFRQHEVVNPKTPDGRITIR